MEHIINMREILDNYNEYKETLDYNIELEPMDENLDDYEIFGVVTKY